MSDGQPEPRENEAPARRPGELGRRVASSLVMALAALAAAWLGGLVFLLFWTAAALALWWEWIGVVKAAPRPVLIAIGAVAIAGMAVSLAADAAAVAFLCAVIGAAVAAAAVQEGRLWIAGGMFYAAAGLVPVVMLRSDPLLGLVAVLWLFAVVWSEDTGAYFAGRYFGGPKLAPSVSPNKTWSGAAGGTLAGVAAGALVVLAAGIEWRPAHVAVALLVVVAAQLGDLFESAVKRRFAVKDASALIPGHGGVMDRLDGFLMAAVAAVAIGLVAGGIQSPARGLLTW